MSFTLGLDLDGVCGDYTSEFRHFVARYLGRTVDQLPDPPTWGFEDAGWGIESQGHFLRLHTNAVRDGMFRSMTPMPGVSDALWSLSNAGVHIRVITHRLIVHGEHGTAAGDTVAWLDRHRIPYRDLCFVARKAQVDADVYVDDAPHNVEALRAEGRHVIVFDAPYNKDLPGPRASSWTECAALILARKAELENGQQSA